MAAIFQEEIEVNDILRDFGIPENEALTIRLVALIGKKKSDARHEVFEDLVKYIHGRNK